MLTTKRSLRYHSHYSINNGHFVSARVSYFDTLGTDAILVRDGREASAPLRMETERLACDLEEKYFGLLFCYG